MMQAIPRRVHHPEATGLSASARSFQFPGAIVVWLGGGENLRSRDLPAMHHSPENFLSSLLLDGVFERHPQLKCGVIELGAAWVPGLVRNLDAAASGFSRNEPLLRSLSMKPFPVIALTR